VVSVGELSNELVRLFDAKLEQFEDANGKKQKWEERQLEKTINGDTTSAKQQHNTSKHKRSRSAITPDMMQLMSIHTPERLYRIRVDLVMLLILNGNDYLPKLRGSSGFDGLLFHYVNVWITYWTERMSIGSDAEDQSTHELYDATDEPFLFDPHTLSLNLPYCHRFFNSSFADTRLKTSIFSNSFNNTLDDEMTSDVAINAATEADELSKKAHLSPISVLYQFIDFGIVPKPATFNLLPYEDYVEQDDDDDHAIPFYDPLTGTSVPIAPNDDPITSETKVLVLTLGHHSGSTYTSHNRHNTGPTDASKQSPKYQFAIVMPTIKTETVRTDGTSMNTTTPVKIVRHALATTALDTIIGEDWKDIASIATELNDDDGNATGIDADTNATAKSFDGGLSWDLKVLAPANVEK